VLLDSHCHLESFAQRGDVPGVLDRAAAAGVTRLITIGTGPADWPLYASLAAAHPGRVDYTVGLHPCDLGPDDSAWQSALALLPAFFQGNGRPVALGEIGLDRFHLPKDPATAAATFARQEAAFRAQLAFARDLTCPVVIHSRQAFADCLRVLDDLSFDYRRIVFHCFSDGPDEMNTLVERGARASFTGIITYKNADLVRAALFVHGPDRLMLETDAPYLAPVPHRGQPNEPAYLPHIARAAAVLFKLMPEALAARTTATAHEFFSLSP
jgi:TatD DNase family protein